MISKLTYLISSCKNMGIIHIFGNINDYTHFGRIKIFIVLKLL